ncbi:MAG: hypothetical protein CM15mP81_00400 [Alphaproteobacteria bacterium]|nr:MAG: hypothetical protein CM15mP81_00400 [Alphaproteobacteria bacterium]
MEVFHTQLKRVVQQLGQVLLSPTNGKDTYGIGAKYVTDFGDIAFGYAQTSFGDKAVTSAYGTGNFTNNDATTVGLKISFKPIALEILGLFVINLKLK